MIKNGYSEKITVKYSEIDQNMAMKPFALLNFLQDITNENAEKWGFGISCLNPKNYTWFLIKYRMEFIEYPKDVRDLVLVTEPRGYNKLFAYRDYELYKKDKLIARMTSLWSIVDVQKRTMIPIATAIGENKYLVPHDKREDDLSFVKIPNITNPELEKAFEVRYNDLDLNGHANNGNYIVWAFEPLDYEFRNKYHIKTLDMYYKKEAKYGEEFTSQVEFVDSNKTLHRLINNNGEEICSIACTWTNES